MGAENVDVAGVELPGGDAAADIAVHDQVEAEILDEEFDVVTQRLAVQGVQDGVAGAVGGGAGALHRAFAEVLGHAAERTLVDLAVLGTREGHAPVFQLIDGLRRVAHQIFDGVLVAQPVRPLDGVVHVPLPLVLAHIAERSRDAALGGHGVRTSREDLGDAGGFQARLAGAERGTQAGAAGAQDNHVIFVVDDVVGLIGH